MTAVRELRTDTELLQAAEWCRDRGEFADCMGDCGRTIATCRQHGDLPIYLHPERGPYCAKCWEETDMSTDNGQFDIDEVVDGEALWETAQSLYDMGNTWPQVTEILEVRTDQKMPHWRTICTEVKKRTAEAPEAPQAPAPPAEDPTPTKPAPKPSVGSLNLATCPPDSVTIDLPFADVGITVTQGRHADGDEFAEIVGRVVRGVFGEVA